MSTNKKRVNVSNLKGLRLYNYLLKRLGEENAKKPKKQRLGLSSRREIVSKQLYPKFKKADKVSLTEISKDINGIIKKLPPSEICNPLYLAEAYLAFVEYYEIDNHIRTVLPDCLDVRVNAGSFGKTKIFNTNSYTYYGDGVRKIIGHVFAGTKVGNDFTFGYANRIDNTALEMGIKAWDGTHNVKYVDPTSIEYVTTPNGSSDKYINCATSKYWQVGLTNLNNPC